MKLWIHWCNAIWLLRPACSRLRTFLWFATCVAGLTVRTDLLGGTRIVRAPGLHARFYHKLLGHCHSPGVHLDAMSALWAQVVLRLFPDPLRINDRLVVVGDGIKVHTRDTKSPAVKLLHQESESNTKPEYIMGHSLQAVSLLVHAAKSVFAVPLAIRIHEGLVWSNRDNRGSTATKSSSGHCSAMGRRCNRLSVLSTARKMSLSTIGSVICCGDPLDDWCVSWRSFIPPEGAAC